MINYQFIHKVHRASSDATPKDSGNLDNSRRVRRKNAYEFDVIYKGDLAGYGWSLDKGRLLWGALWDRKLINPHYQWFSKGVHNNIMNTIVSELGGKSKKQYNMIEPKSNTYQPSTDKQMLDDQQRKNYENSIRVQRKWNSRFLKETMEKGEMI